MIYYNVGQKIYYIEFYNFLLEIETLNNFVYWGGAKIEWIRNNPSYLKLTDNEFNKMIENKTKIIKNLFK